MTKEGAIKHRSIIEAFARGEEIYYYNTKEEAKYIINLTQNYCGEPEFEPTEENGIRYRIFHTLNDQM